MFGLLYTIIASIVKGIHQAGHWMTLKLKRHLASRP